MSLPWSPPFLRFGTVPSQEDNAGMEQSDRTRADISRRELEGNDAMKDRPMSRDREDVANNHGRWTSTDGRPVNLAHFEHDKATAADRSSRLGSQSHIGGTGDKEHGRRTRHDRDPLDDMRMKIRSLEWANDTLRKDLQISTRERSEARDEIVKLRRLNAGLHHDLSSTGQRLAAEYAHQQRELHAVRDELHRVQASHEATRRQLAERTAELQGAQLFINHSDSLSAADVIAMANDLNAEILQSAAFMADSMDYTGEQPAIPEAVEEARLCVGEDLTQALVSSRVQSGDHDYDPTRVQLALQVCLVRCCGKIVKSWTLGGDEQILEDVYKIIFQREKQSAAGRWRSMTQAHATKSDAYHRCLEHITRSAVTVLRISGCSSQATKDLPSSFHERLSVINDLALRLRAAIGEQVTSMDIVPYIIQPGSAFMPENMDDTYEERGAGRGHKVGERVAGSTELGLATRVATSEGQIGETVMLKPKVILCSALEEDDKN
ncbi:hypothetical protein LshimejAT787_0410190 [Lyophyllum shimeji]|uniref:Uncharacterized protein n=1 Tax=Lyophyllum shimeji TaxID=47721 RepID=A0A9P3PM49_LYOSH|nr:hypothetical protein LshimejAT787_0410190 [Lyophyllum shimeji]